MPLKNPPAKTSAPASRRSWLSRVLGAASLALLALGLTLLKPAWDTATWPTVQGTIVEHRPFSQLQGTEVKYGLKAVYTYTVAAVHHRTDRYSQESPHLPGLYPSTELAEKAGQEMTSLAKWRVGQPVTVYYNPAAPADAVLAKASITHAVSVLLLAVALGALAITKTRQTPTRPLNAKKRH